jgi:hypothetical protein
MSIRIFKNLDLSGREFVAPLGEGPSELLRADLPAFLLVSLERGHDDVVGVVRT